VRPQGTVIISCYFFEGNSGDTTVSAGTLEVTSAFFDDASTVYISSGAILNLNHSATDDILYLYLASVKKPAGTYSLALGNASGYLSGGGSLKVTLPEPATLALLGLGGLGLILGRKRR
jgi:hypothetical protein